MFRKIRRYLRDPYYEIGYDMLTKHPNWMSDKWWLSIVWEMSMGYRLDWKHPKTLNEKLQWLKLYDRNPLYPTLVDKIAVKDWVAKRIGEQYVIPTLAVYDSVNEIDLDKLPNQFVLKCNHDSGSVVICKDKSSFDLEKAKQKLDKALKYNFYYRQREWPYKYIKPCIFAEAYIGDDDSELIDYKFYCYGGRPRYVMYSVGEAEHNVRNHKFDINGNSIDYLFKKSPTIRKEDITLPANLPEMVFLVEKLCETFQFVRVDLYNKNGQIYMGELTLWSGGGIINIDSKEYSQLLADEIDISKIRNKHS